MNNDSKKLSPSDLLAGQFLERAKEFQANIELIKVLKSRTYKIGEANVLVRASSEGNRRYFFGINYITVEDIAEMLNANFKTISEHTRKLNSSGLVNKRYKGRYVAHELSPYGKQFIKFTKSFQHSG